MALALFAGSQGSAKAVAIVYPTSIWEFTGDCTDCTGQAQGTLTQANNSFTFSYSSNLIFYTLNPANLIINGFGQAAGDPLNILATDDVMINGTGTIYTTGAPGSPASDFTGGIIFSVSGSSSHSWFSNAADFGTNGAFAQVAAPEVDASAAAGALGLLSGLMLVIRGRKRS